MKKNSGMEINPKTSVKEFLMDVGDGNQFSVKHYNHQDKLFQSDYDRYLIELEQAVQNRGEEQNPPTGSAQS